jgi:hypothetical protein
MSIPHPKTKVEKVDYNSLTLEQRYNYWAVHLKELDNFLRSSTDLSDEKQERIMTEMRSIMQILKVLK